MKSLLKNKKRIFALTVAIVAVFALSINAFSLWQSDASVNINPKDIPPSTMAIGTHLIHIKALTNVHYDVAMQSVAESTQSKIYYKSELADGAWFDITAGSTIADITTGDNQVPDSVIKELFFDYHTTEDGVTTDLRRGTTKNIFDINNPYDLEAMPELFPNKSVYDQEVEIGKNERKIAWLRDFFGLNVRNYITMGFDEDLKSLDRYYKVLNDNGGTQANKETVMRVQESVDASRRVEVFNQVGTRLKSDLDYLMVNEKQIVYDEDEDEVGELPTGGNMPELQTPYSDSLANVETSTISYMGKALLEGTSIMSKLKYEFQTDLIKDARSKNDIKCDEDVVLLQALDNIASGVVVDREKELSLLETRLIPQAESTFEEGTRAGENQDYKTAVADRSSGVILDKVITNYYNELYAKVAELETYLDGKCLRVENSAAQELIGEKLQKAYTYAEKVPIDAFSAKANQVIQEYIIWLEKKLASLIAAAGGTEADLLSERKDGLTEEYLAALDDNDLVGAKAIMNELNNLTGQIAELGGESKDARLIKAAVDEAKGLINDSSTGNRTPGPNMDRLSSLLDSLEGMMTSNFKNAFPAVQEISDAMKAAKYGAGTGTGSSGAGSGSGDGSGSGNGSGSGDGSGSGNGSGDGNGSGSGSGAGVNKKFDDLIDKAGGIIMSNQALYEAGTVGIVAPADMDAIINGYLSGLDGFNDQGKMLIKITALNKLLMLIEGNKFYDQVNAKMNNTAATESIKGNPYVFPKMKVMEGVYAPVTAVSAKSGLRYVWYISRDNATLAKGALRYEFTAFSKQVVKNGQAVDMPLPALSQNVLYIPAGYINSEWTYTTLNLIRSEYGILIDNEIDECAEELLALLQK